jgi:hypothetical protein
MTERPQEHVSENSGIDIFSKTTFSFTLVNNILKCLKISLEKNVSFRVVKPFVELNIEQKNPEKIPFMKAPHLFEEEMKC